MSVFTERTSKKIDMVFVLGLITLFAVTSLALVLIGAKQYRFVTGSMSENHQLRTTSSYLAEKIRQNDAADAISICDLQGTPALSITSSEGDVTYLTYIYFYEDALRELVVTRQSLFSLSVGQPIIEMQDFSIQLVNDSLIRAEITDTNGKKQIILLPLRCSVRKEES